MSRRSKLTSGSGRIRAAGVWGNNGRVGARGGDGNGQGSERESMGFIRGRSRRARCASYLLGGGKQKCACAQPRLVSVQLWTQSSHVQDRLAKRVAQRAHTKWILVGRLNVCVTLYLSIFVTSVRFGVACTRMLRAQAHHCLRPHYKCSSRSVNNTPSCV